MRKADVVMDGGEAVDGPLDEGEDVIDPVGRIEIGPHRIPLQPGAPLQGFISKCGAEALGSLGQSHGFLVVAGSVRRARARQGDLAPQPRVSRC